MEQGFPTATGVDAAGRSGPARRAQRDREAGASLRALRLLVGHLAARDPSSLAALAPGAGAADRRPLCALVYGVTAAALAVPRIRRGLDARLAAELGPLARRLVGLPVATLAREWAARRPDLAEPELVALLWAAHAHPCPAARRLEERVADELERRQRAA